MAGRDRAAARIFIGDYLWFLPVRSIGLVMGYAADRRIVFPPRTGPKNIVKMARMYPSEKLKTLCRFLQARKSDVKAATAMFENYKKRLPLFRSPSNALKYQEIIGTGRRAILRQFGRAKDGTLVLGFTGCLIDASRYTPEDLANAVGWFTENFMNQKRFENPRYTVLVATNAVENAPNVSARQLIPYFKAFANVMSDFFPETLEKLVIFPFPWLGRVLWNIVKYFIDPVTRGKIMFVGGSTSRHAPLPREIFKYLAENQIPKGWMTEELPKALPKPMKKPVAGPTDQKFEDETEYDPDTVVDL